MRIANKTTLVRRKPVTTRRWWPKACLISLVCLLTVGSCAYYNTFYNAQQAFKAAERERKNRKGQTVSTQETSAYKKAIEKASKVLELYSTSKYVDDALLMLGKCFYYQAEYAKAERKFEELLTLFPGTALAEEALVWRARTRIAQNQLDHAASDCRQVIATSRSSHLRDEAEYLIAEIDFARKDYRAAAARFSEAAKRIGDREVRSTAYAKLGECYLELGDFRPAARAFQAAAKYAVIDNLRHEATLKMGRALREAGDLRAAESVFLRMANDPLAKQYWPDAKLELAECLLREGQLDEAISGYEALIKDHPRTEASARAHYALAKVYEEHYTDYAKAREHYEQVKAEAPRCELVPAANARVADIERLLRLRATIAELTGQSFVADSIQQAATPMRPDTTAPEMRDLMALTPEGPPDTSLAVFIRGSNQPRMPVQPTKTPISPYPGMDLITAHLQLAELFYFQLARGDSAIAHYWHAYHVNPDSSSAAQALYPIAYILRTAQGDTARADSLLWVILERFPESPQAEGARRVLGLPKSPCEEDLAATLFWQADSFLWETDFADSALSIFAAVSTKFPESEYAPRALYAIAWVLEQKLHDGPRALEAYKKLLALHPNSPQGKAAKRKLEVYEREAEKLRRLAEAGARADSSATAPVPPPEEEQLDQDEQPPSQAAAPDSSAESKSMLQRKKE